MTSKRVHERFHDRFGSAHPTGALLMLAAATQGMSFPWWLWILAVWLAL